MIKKTNGKIEIDLGLLVPNFIKVVVFLVLGIIAFYTLKADVQVLTERMDNWEEYFKQDSQELKDEMKEIKRLIQKLDKKN